MLKKMLYKKNLVKKQSSGLKVDRKVQNNLGLTKSNVKGRQKKAFDDNI